MSVVYAGDPEWINVTVGISADIHAWLVAEAKRRGLARAEVVRGILIAQYANDIKSPVKYFQGVEREG
jgi:hypothetical protein